MPQPNWEIAYYVTHNDRCPVEEFLNGLSVEERVRANWHIDRLEEMGPDLPFPYAEYLRDKILELRIRCRNVRLRILYFQDGALFVLTHGFVKKSSAVQDSEIEKAVDYRRDYFAGKREV